MTHRKRLARQCAVLFDRTEKLALLHSFKYEPDFAARTREGHERVDAVYVVELERSGGGIAVEEILKRRNGSAFSG